MADDKNKTPASPAAASPVASGAKAAKPEDIKPNVLGRLTTSKSAFDTNMPTHTGVLEAVDRAHRMAYKKPPASREEVLASARELNTLRKQEGLTPYDQALISSAFSSTAQAGQQANPPLPVSVSKDMMLGAVATDPTGTLGYSSGGGSAGGGRASATGPKLPRSGAATGHVELPSGASGKATTPGEAMPGKPSAKESVPAAKETTTAKETLPGKETAPGKEKESTGAQKQESAKAKPASQKQEKKSAGKSKGVVTEKKQPKKEEGSESTCSNNCTKAGEPIDVVTGELVMEQADLLLPGDLPISLERHYRSATPVQGLFGSHWFSTWGQSIKEGRKRITFYAEDAFPLSFDRPERQCTTTHTYQRKIQLTSLTRGWQILTAIGQTLTFSEYHNGQWWLTRIADRNGNHIDFQYEEGALRQVVHSSGYRLLVEGEPGAISRILLESAQGKPATELVQYEYNRDGTLAWAAYPGGSYMRYHYDSAHRITRWEDSRGNWYGYVYDGEGRCVEGKGISGAFANLFHYDTAQRVTTFTDSFGAKTLYQYNEQKLVTRIIYPDGSVTHTEWDELGRKIKETDGNGSVSQYHYDPYGNLIQHINALGQATRVHYNKQHLPIAITESGGEQWVRNYDERGNLISAGRENGLLQTYCRNDRGQLIEVVTSDGRSAQFGYHPNGLLLWASDFQERITQFERDDHGRVTARIDPLKRRTEYRYHATGGLAQVTLPDGVQLGWDYDSEGNLIHHQDARGQQWQYDYGPFDKLIAVTEPNGATTRYGWDAELRLRKVTNPMGQVYSYGYTHKGQLLDEIDFDGRKTAYEYDPAGYLIAHLPPQGGKHHYRRNAIGQLLQKITPDRVIRFEYDASGRMTAARTFAKRTTDEMLLKQPLPHDKLHIQDPLFALQLLAETPETSVTFEHDAFGRLIQESQNGRRVSSGYNARGQRERRQTASGHQSLWAYDPNGLSSELTFAGDEQFQFLRDAIGQETQRRIFGKRQAGTGPFAEQAPTQRFADVGEGFSLLQKFDPRGRLTRQWAGDKETLCERDYEYDPQGNPTHIDDVRWGKTRFENSKNGQVLYQHTQPPAWKTTHTQEAEEYAYDLAGNLIAAVQHKAGILPQRKQFGYQRHQLEQAGDTRYKYDSAGRLIERIEGKRWQAQGMEDGRRVWHYQWDSENRLAAVITPEGIRWTYTYDAFGRRLSKRGHKPLNEGDKPDAYTKVDISYLWDRYTLAEEVSKITHPNGEIEETIAVWEYEPGTFKPVSKTVYKEQKQQTYAVITDLVGMPRELVTTEGKVAWIGRTTLWGEVKEQHSHKEYGTDCTMRFPGQWYDEESRLCYNWHRYYDPETARYITPDPLGLAGGPNQFAYVPNPLVFADPLGLSCEDDPHYIPRDNQGNPIPISQQRINGQDIPLPMPEAEGVPHTVLGGRVGTDGDTYRQSATFPGGTWPSANGKDVPWSRVDWTSHGRGDHTDPHQHVFTIENGTWTPGPNTPFYGY